MRQVARLLSILLVTLTLFGACGSTGQPTESPRPISAAIDSIAARAIADALFAQLKLAIARTASDTATAAWEIRLPGAPRAIWDEVRARSLLLLHGRGLLPTDSVRNWAKVLEVKITHDSMTAQLSVGSAIKCPRSWMEDDFGFLARWGRVEGGGWGPPTVKPNYWSESFYRCP